jgi:hypothetical protein
MYISKPCPVYFKNNDKIGNNYHCKSCNKIVVDYTNMSIEEIKASFTKNTCGIFREDQLSRKTSLTWTSAIRFYLLMLISFVGFHVQPIQAQTVANDSIAKDTTMVKKTKGGLSTETDSDKKELKTTKKRKGLFRRKKVYHFKPIGCPDF